MTIHLSILLFFPLALALLGALLPRGLAPAAWFAGSLVALAYAVLLLLDFHSGTGGLQYVTDDAWIDELGIRYTLGVDGLNLWLVALTTLLFAFSALWITLRPPEERPKLFVFHMGLAETAVLGAFLAQDLILFVLFFDLMLVPFYFLVGQWGGPDRVAATFKLVVYTLVGSLLMLAAAVATGVLAGAATDGERDVLDPGARERRPRGEHAALALRRVRARVPDQDAGVPVPRPGCPTATATCRCRRWPCSPPCSRRSPRTASCASCCPSSPTRRRTSRRSCSCSRSPRSSTARSWPSRSRTCG